MNEIQHLSAVKDTLLSNLDAQLAHVRFRYGCNFVLQPDSIENELAGVKRILEKITSIHEVANAIETLRYRGINKPL